MEQKAPQKQKKPNPKQTCLYFSHTINIFVKRVWGRGRERAHTEKDFFLKVHCEILNME